MDSVPPCVKPIALVENGMGVGMGHGGQTYTLHSFTASKVKCVSLNPILTPIPNHPRNHWIVVVVVITSAVLSRDSPFNRLTCPRNAPFLGLYLTPMSLESCSWRVLQITRSYK